MSKRPILGERQTTLEAFYVWSDEGVYLRHSDVIELFSSKKKAISRLQDLAIEIIAEQINQLRLLINPSPEEMKKPSYQLNQVEAPPELTWQSLTCIIKSDVREQSGRLEIEWGIKVADRVEHVGGRQPYGIIKASVADLVHGEMQRKIRR